jgi:hypothetical protein
MSTSTEVWTRPPAVDELDTTVVCLPIAETVQDCPMTGRQDCAGADTARCPAC